jgi:cell division protein FtsB
MTATSDKIEIEETKNRHNNLVIGLIISVLTILVGFIGYTAETLSGLKSDVAVVKVTSQKDNAMILNSVIQLETSVKNLEVRINDMDMNGTSELRKIKSKYYKFTR